MRIPRPEVARIARQLLGAPFRLYGRNKNGVDCVGLLLYVAYELGVTDYDTRVYDCTVGGDDLMAPLREQFIEVDTKDPIVGDIMVFWTRSDNTPRHVGIRTHRGFIHVCNNKKGVVEVSLDDNWRRRIFSILEYPEPWQA